jgi:uncharacterized protein YbjT (DUF2867 family)
MNPLVFGASGSIGRALTRAAVEAGHQVNGLARSEATAEIARRLGTTPIPADRADPAR